MDHFLISVVMVYYGKHVDDVSSLIWPRLIRLVKPAISTIAHSPTFQCNKVHATHHLGDFMGLLQTKKTQGGDV